jgi:hypothetical protein
VSTLARLLARFGAWAPYDPAWLVALARAQHPDEPWLADALSRCTQARGAGTVYVRFVSHRHANQPGAPWQYDRSIELADPEAGVVLVDVLRNGRIGGIEMLDLEMGRPGAGAPHSR